MWGVFHSVWEIITFTNAIVLVTKEKGKEAAFGCSFIHSGSLQCLIWQSFYPRCPSWLNPSGICVSSRETRKQSLERKIMYYLCDYSIINQDLLPLILAIHLSIFLTVFMVAGGWSLTQLSQGKRQSTLWRGHIRVVLLLYGIDSTSCWKHSSCWSILTW